MRGEGLTSGRGMRREKMSEWGNEGKGLGQGQERDERGRERKEEEERKKSVREQM